MLLAFLACGAFFPAKAENGYFVQGYVKTDGEVLNERPADITPMIEWDSRIELSDNPINGATFFGWNVKNEEYKSKVSSIHAFLEIKKDNATYLAKTQFKDANANASDWGQINTNNMEPGNYTNILYLEVTWTDNTTSTYEFGPFNYTIKDSTEPKQPTLSISDPSYTYKDASTVTASIKVNYENPDNVAIQGIRVGAVGAPGEAVAGKEYRHDWNKTDDGTGDIVWGDIMLPANWETGIKTVSFDLVNLPENNANINAYFKAYIIPTEGANIEAAQQHLVVSTVNNNPTPALSIAEASCAYKSATSVTASMKLNVTNFTGNVILAVLTKNTMQGITSFWNQPGDKIYQVLAQTTVSVADAAAGVTFDVEGLPESASTPILFAARTVAPGETPVYAPTVDGTANTSQTEPGMVNTVYSESYNVAPYTDGISYTAANFNENGSVLWTFPSWTDDEVSRRANGISGRWVWIESSATKFAPNIIYAISNDKDGYIYFKMKIDEKATLPENLEPHMWVNNNRGEKDGAETVKMKLEADGYWHWKSTWQYPNNSTVSYQLHLAFTGGSSKTRVFGYDVINAVDAPAKKSASEELTELARKHFKDDHFAAQIYIMPAYDAYSAPQDDFKDKPIPVGTWSHTRCPNDFANLNTEAYHFSPELHYILTNDSQENASGTQSKLYFAFQLGDSYGMVKNEAGVMESRSLKTIIPNDYVPQLRILKPKANTASTLSDAATRAADNYDEIEVIDMTQVRGYLNTYEGTTTKEYDPNSEFVVGIKHTFTSIMNGEGYSRMQPRPYVMSSDDKVVTGIEEVASEAEAVPAVATVYNLQGMAVRVNVATENALEGLPAGIYFVNGKKYAVR